MNGYLIKTRPQISQRIEPEAAIAAKRYRTMDDPVVQLITLPRSTTRGSPVEADSNHCNH